MPEVEISIDEVEEGVFGKSDYRLDLKFYSTELRRDYARLLRSKYPLVLVKDVVDPVEEGVHIENDKEYLYLQIGDVDGEVGEVANWSTVLGRNLPSRAQIKLSKGDVVVSSVRPRLKEIAIVPDNLDGQIGTNGFIALRCTKINPRYLLYILRSEPVTSELDRRSSALNYPAINDHDLLYLQIPCPLPEIQSKLADDFTNSLGHIREIRKKERKLTEEKNSVVSDCLRKENKPSVSPQVEYTIDEVETHEHRADVKFYRYSRKHPYEYLDLEVIGDLGKFRADTVDITKYPDEEFVQLTASRYSGIIFRERKLGKDIKTKKQLTVKTNDVLISRIDLYNGCLGIVPEEFNDAIVTNDFMVLIPNRERIDPFYLVEVLKDEYMADYFYAFSVGCTGRKRITLDTFKTLKIPLLKKTAQEDIAVLMKSKQQEIKECKLKIADTYKKAEDQFMRSLGILN